MKITSIAVSNYLGIKEFNFEPKQKVLLVAGFNGAGKSSMAEAIRHALLGDYSRVNFKKDLYQFLNEDAAAGYSIINTTLGEFGVSLPSGDVAGESVLLSPALPFCLTPEKFAGSIADDRRKALFSLMGIKVSADEILRRLAAKKADPDLVATIRPYLSGGFKPAEKEAAENARDEKANWRAITGEAWGDKKADAWKATIQDVPDMDADPKAIADLEAQLAAANSDLGGLLEKRTAASKAVDAPQNANVEELRSKAAQFAQFQDDFNSAVDIEKLLNDQYNAIEIPSTHIENIVACPHCAGVVKIDGGKLVVYDQQSFNPELAEAKTKERDAKELELTAAIAKTRVIKEKLAEADAAARALNAIESAAEVVAQPDPASFDHAIAAKREEVKAINEHIGSLRALQKENEEAARQVKAAKDKTNSAAVINQVIKSWLLIADALSPEGIQADLLSEALDPFNKELESIANNSGWMKVNVDESMNIYIDRQPYNLRSESERWRADAMIAAAFAKISGAGLIILDRFDVLDLASRSDLMVWLAKVELDQVIALGTMKAPLTANADFLESVWLS